MDATGRKSRTALKARALVGSLGGPLEANSIPDPPSTRRSKTGRDFEHRVHRFARTQRRAIATRFEGNVAVEVDDSPLSDPHDVDGEPHALHPERVEGRPFIGEVHALTPGELISIAEPLVLFSGGFSELDCDPLRADFDPGIWLRLGAGDLASKGEEQEEGGGQSEWASPPQLESGP